MNSEITEISSEIGKGLLSVIVILLFFVVIVIGVLTLPDKRTGREKLGNTIYESPQWSDKAASELEDRTLDDTARDNKDATKDSY
jgi:hypothetical protein